MVNKETCTAKVLYTVEVLKAKDFSKDGKNAIVFDAKVNGITIYNLIFRWGEKDGKAWKLIDFPKVKGKDEKWYNRIWFPVSRELCEIVHNALTEMI